MSFVERGVWIAARSSSDTWSSPIGRPTAPRSTPVSRDLDFGSGPGRRSAGSRRAGDPRVLAERRRLRGRHPARAGRNAVALDSLTLNVYRTNGSLVGTRSVPDARRRRADLGLERPHGGAAPSGTAATSCSWSGAPAGRTFHAPSSRPATPAQVAAFGVTVDTVAPTVRAASASTTLISPNGDGNHDAVRLAMTVGRRDALGASRRRPGRHAPDRDRQRRVDRVHLARRPDTAARASPTAATRLTLGVIDAAGNQAPALVRRSSSIRRGPSSRRPRPRAVLSPERRRRPATRRGLRWSANERRSGTVALCCRAHGRPLAGPCVRVRRLGHELERANRGRRSASATGRYVLRVDLADAGGNRRAGDAHGRRRPDGRASCAGRVTSSRRTATRSRRPRPSPAS